MGLFYVVIVKLVYIRSVTLQFIIRYSEGQNMLRVRLFREGLEQMEDQKLYRLLVELVNLVQFLLMMMMVSKNC